MAKKTIMLVCSAGMSTSLLVTKMEQAAVKKGIDTEIFAVSSSEASDYAAKKDIDVLLLGPQVRFLKNQFEEKFVPQGIPVEVINMSDYGMMNGENVLNSALDLIDKK